MKREKKKNVIKNENHEHKTIAQRTQSDDNRDMNNINNQSAESVSDDEIIEEEKNFSLIKFSNEEFFIHDSRKKIEVKQTSRTQRHDDAIK